MNETAYDQIDAISDKTPLQRFLTQAVHAEQEEEQEEACAEYNRLRKERDTLEETNVRFLKANTEVGLLNATLQIERDELRKAILSGRLLCPSCGTELDCDGGYWWCPNKDCGQSPEFPE